MIHHTLRFVFMYLSFLSGNPYTAHVPLIFEDNCLGSWSPYHVKTFPGSQWKLKLLIGFVTTKRDGCTDKPWWQMHEIFFHRQSCSSRSMRVLLHQFFSLWSEWWHQMDLPYKATICTQWISILCRRMHSIGLQPDKKWRVQKLSYSTPNIT